MPGRIGIKVNISAIITPEEKPVTQRNPTIWTSTMDAPPE
jgi:hypothetical protein